MPTLGVLHDVTNVATQEAVNERNAIEIEQSLFFRYATRINGIPVATLGAPTFGTWLTLQTFTDAYGGDFICTAGGSPGTWIQLRPAVVTAYPGSPTMNYWIIRADLNFGQYLWNGSAWISIGGGSGGGYAATSTTSLLIGTGSKAFTTQASLAYVVGSRVRIVRAGDVTAFMEGDVTAYSGTGMTVLVANTSGSGTFTDWNLTIAGLVGITGSAGAAGAGYAATSASSLSTAGSGSKTFTTQAGLAYTAGARLRATSTGSGNWMEGVVTSYSGTTLIATMDLNSGSGTNSDWDINLAGQQGATGGSGSAGAGYGGTSTTSTLIGTGSKVFTTQAGLAYVVGSVVRVVRNGDVTAFMDGTVTAYSGTSITVDVTSTSGAGTFTDWNFTLTGTQLGNTTPNATGTAAAGTSALGAHQDHVHALGDFSTAYPPGTTARLNIPLLR